MAESNIQLNLLIKDDTPNLPGNKHLWSLNGQDDTTVLTGMHPDFHHTYQLCSKCLESFDTGLQTLEYTYV